MHLHVHTEYSMLDGAARIDELFASAAAQGMPAIATTDHGYIYGAYEFWAKARKYDIKPIIGVEAYITPGTARGDKTRVKFGDGGRDDVGGNGAYTHMTLLSRNNTGMHNLFRMSSLASLEGHYYKPRMDRELLSRYAEGLIGTTGCVGGEIQTRLRFGHYDQARQAASDLRDIFGREHFYAEVMDHGIPIERQTKAELLRLAKDLGLPLLATNDLHYTKPDDARGHAALLCVQSASTLMDPGRFKFDAENFYLRTPAEMRQLFRELPEACDNTLAVAEQCEVSFVEKEGQYMPRFPCPPGEDETSWFVKEVEKGLQARYPDGVPEASRKQAAYEIDVIVGKGYPGYFLVVADFINWAKDHGIRVGPGRGSGAGSMCAYAMRITDLDPLKHGLIFERFLNPERPSMPDFDVDFDERRRGEVIRYVTDKYGDDRVAQIVTYGTIKAKQAVKDAARVLGHPFSMGDRLTKAMPADVMGKGVPLKGIFDKEHPRYADGADFRALHDEDPVVQEIVATAIGLEGLKRQAGVHAAGVIMSSEPLTDLIPIMKREQDGQIITQFDYPSCERLGLVKMDFLGLRNLTILDDAIENIRDNRGEEIDLDALSETLDDPATYQLLARGDTLGVFQLDGGGMRTLLKLMQPDNFEDISAALALYRPGPMGVDAHTNFALRKNGRQKEVPLDPKLDGQLEPAMIAALEPILGTTYGLCVAGDTPIVDADTGERVRVDELEDRVRRGFHTFGADESGQVVRRRVSYWWQMPDKPILTVSTAAGNTLRLSADHKVLTPRGWVPAGDLVPGVDRIARPRTAQAFIRPSGVSGDEAALLGYLLSDGYITCYENTFISSQPTLRAEVSRLALALFDDTYPVEDCLDRRAPRVRFAAAPSGCGKGGNPRRGVYSMIGINRWLRDLGFSGKATRGHKLIPEAIKRADIAARRRLIAALWDGDGYVGPKLAFYKTISHTLALDIAEVLSSLGVPATVRWDSAYESARFGPQNAWTVHVYDDRFWETIAPLMVHRGKVTARATIVLSSHSRGLNRARMLEHAGDVLRRDPGLATRMRNSMGSGPASVAGLHRHLYRRGPVPAPATTFVKDDGSGRYPLNETARGYLAAMGTTEDHFYASFDWTVVADVTRGAAEPVFDITVEDVHNFISSGLVLSNCVYQEQVMELAQKLAGYTLGTADLLRRAMGKKKKEVIAAEFDTFSAGMQANGFSLGSVQALWEVLVPFSDYAFNKAHTAAYGLVSYWTGYLKANYPAEYMAALLTSVRDDKDKSALYLNESRRMGITVLPPSVNESKAPFTAVGTDIRFGLEAIRNVGRNVVDAIVSAREEKGKFTSFDDFLTKVPVSVCNKRTIESLIRGGAFDDLGYARAGLLREHEHYVEAYVDAKRQEAMGQDSLFGSFGDADDDEALSGVSGLPPITAHEWDKRTKLAHERDMLGLYVSDHPLLGIEHVLSRNSDTAIAALIEDDSPHEDGAVVTVAGLITSMAVKRNKRGEPYATVTVEDLGGAVEIMFFTKTYLAAAQLLAMDAVCSVKARVRRRDDGVQLSAMELTLPELTEGPRGPVVISMEVTRATTPRIEELKTVLTSYPGATEVHLKLVQPGRSVLLRLDDQFRVDATESLIGDLKVLLGARAVS